MSGQPSDCQELQKRGWARVLRPGQLLPPTVCPWQPIVQFLRILEMALRCWHVHLSPAVTFVNPSCGGFHEGGHHNWVCRLDAKGRIFLIGFRTFPGKLHFCYRNHTYNQYSPRNVQTPIKNIPSLATSLGYGYRCICSFDDPAYPVVRGVMQACLQRMHPVQQWPSVENTFQL